MTGTGRRILAPGRNCWTVKSARRCAVLIDAAAYFRRLDQALRLARRSILIVGWDFDGRIALRPDGGHGTPQRLGDLLLELVEARPELEVHILIWDYSVFYGPGAALPLLLGGGWQDHPRIHLHLDDRHPLRGAHHQKLVCIDDSLAFAGGIDLTVGRWDTQCHSAGDPARIDPDGRPHAPVHDMQMAVDGAAARAVSAVARERWRIATGERLPPVPGDHNAWPHDLAPDFTDTPVAVARTAPAYGGEPAIHEGATLALDALAAARGCIYIEAQYLTAAAIGDRLVEKLSAADGPEIVVLVTRSSTGLIERFLMGSNRDRLIRRLMQADRFDRLRVYYPVGPGPAGKGEDEILVHAKLIIVDDDFVRIGSSNLNNRSVGLDTECDLAIEAPDDAARRAIAGLRERLLAEHLGVAPEDVARATASQGSLVRAIEALNRNPRRLRPFPITGEDGPSTTIPGTGLLDPEHPFEPLRPLWGDRDES
ncbi:MAG TPA: phospholipase D-like domain-containing protein [Arenibaculum sp.]|nr:phospholipase D-like domain-containing protein [Arenibaculum sp.]